MKGMLTKKELKEILGGLSQEGALDTSNELDKLNINRVEFCKCNYINNDGVVNVNKVYCCQCHCK